MPGRSEPEAISKRQWRPKVVKVERRGETTEHAKRRWLSSVDVDVSNMDAGIDKDQSKESE